jgi:predicted nucleic acid-binding protein
LNQIFVDTSGWANLFIASESYHDQAKKWFLKSRQQQDQLITSNYVITELVALFHSPLRVPRPQLFQYIEAITTASYITIVHIDRNIHNEAWQLVKNRPDKNWSLVDATSFVIMKQRKLSLALTTDRHFEQAGFIKILNN